MRGGGISPYVICWYSLFWVPFEIAAQLKEVFSLQFPDYGRCFHFRDGPVKGCTYIHCDCIIESTSPCSPPPPTQEGGGSFTCGSLLHSSRYLVSGCGNSEVLIWDLKNKNIIKTFQVHTAGPKKCWQCTKREYYYIMFAVHPHNLSQSWILPMGPGGKFFFLRCVTNSTLSYVPTILSVASFFEWYCPTQWRLFENRIQRLHTTAFQILL